MKFGDVVIYEESGKQYNATVIGPLALPYTWKPGDPLLVGRELGDHAGSAGEPLLHLVFAKEVLDMHSKPSDLSGTGSWSKCMQIRIDVAHKSHEYSIAAQKQFNSKRYEGGRWSELKAGK